MSGTTKRLKIKAIVHQDDAYRSVFAEGANAVANKIEQSIYSCAGPQELVSDLAKLVASARELEGA